MFLSLFYWCGAFALNLLFLKRFILVDSIILLIVILIINSFRNQKKISNLRLIISLSVVIVIVSLFNIDMFKSLFEATFNRIETSSDDLAGFDRWVESKNYLKEASFIKLIFGNGFTSAHYGLGKESFALHIGWINFIFKGGFIFLLIIIIPYFKLLKIIKIYKIIDLKVKFSFWFMIVYFFRLSYGNMSGFAPEMLIFFYSVFNVMDLKLKSKINK